jgi:hypothetical protein
MAAQPLTEKPGQADDQKKVLRGNTASDGDEDDILAHFPRSIPKNNRGQAAFKNGVSSILDKIGQCLCDGKLPFDEAVQHQIQTDASAPDALSRFFEMGGSVENTLRAFFKFTKQHNIKEGDGKFYTEYEDEIKALPVCENDNRVSFVRAMVMHEASRAGVLTETEKQRNYHALLERSRVSFGPDSDF